MSEQRLTDWFPADVKPARPGWYLREWKTACVRGIPDYFDGKHWYLPDPNGKSLWRLKTGANKRWRGLAEPPMTDWFPADTPPVHVGVYEKKIFGDVKWFQYWDGERWWYGHSTAELTAAAFATGEDHGVPAARPWRGLAVQP